MTATATSEVAFAYHIKTEDGLARALCEHGDGRRSIVTFLPGVAKAAPKRPHKPECTFTMEELIRTATMAFTSDPAIQEDRMAGKKLAAGVLMLASAIGILDMKEG